MQWKCQRSQCLILYTRIKMVIFIMFTMRFFLLEEAIPITGMVLFKGLQLELYGEAIFLLINFHKYLIQNLDFSKIVIVHHSQLLMGQIILINLFSLKIQEQSFFKLIEHLELMKHLVKINQLQEKNFIAINLILSILPNL